MADNQSMIHSDFVLFIKMTTLVVDIQALKTLKKKKSDPILYKTLILLGLCKKKLVYKFQFE